MTDKPDAATPQARRRSKLGALVMLALIAINDMLDWLNYTSGNPHFQKDPDGSIVYTPSWVDPQMRYRMQQKYFHRCTLRGCGYGYGCGYDGLWIYPGNCPALRDDIKYGPYNGC